MYINIISSYRNIIAVADKELIGKQFSEEERMLDVKESFYKGEGNSVTEEEAIDIMQDWKKEDATFNIVGQKSITVALKAKLIDKNSIGKIEGIPYALILL